MPFYLFKSSRLIAYLTPQAVQPMGSTSAVADTAAAYQTHPIQCKGEVRPARKSSKIRIIGAGCWRRGKMISERENKIHK